MAALTVTAAKVAPVNPSTSRIRSRIAAETVAAGQAAYTVAASGRAGLASANTAGKEQFSGIFLGPASAGQQVDVLEEGEVGGFDLSGMNYDAPAYLNDTAGVIGDAVSATKTVAVGRVRSLTDSLTAPTKVLYVQARVNASW